VECARAASGELELRVRDHGPGVPEAQLPHLFEPFYRGESELTREHQGTGLGLSLVRDLARAMHGCVEARNACPGLKLRVRLPLGAAEVADGRR
jgi:protein-histidine pros-kinase